MRVKLFPNFTRHHLITHTNLQLHKLQLPLRRSYLHLKVCNFTCDCNLHSPAKNFNACYLVSHKTLIRSAVFS